MVPIVAPPPHPGQRRELYEREISPFAPLFLLWVGIALATINFVSPALLGFLPLESSSRHLLIAGLSMPAFLSQRRIAQPLASLLLGFAILSYYLEYLHQGQLP